MGINAVIQRRIEHSRFTKYMHCKAIHCSVRAGSSLLEIYRNAFNLQSLQCSAAASVYKEIEKIFRSTAWVNLLDIFGKSYILIHSNR